MDDKVQSGGMGMDQGRSHKMLRPYHWRAAAIIGLLVGIIFIFFPFGGAPWMVTNGASGAIMGRTVTLQGTGATALRIIIHLALAVFYSFIIAAVARRFESWRGIIAGGVTGLVLYGGNFAVTRATLPQFTGAAIELHTVVCHVIFGLVVAALYKGVAAGHPAVKTVN